MLTLGNKLTLNSQPIYHFVNKYSIDFDGVDDVIVTDGADTVVQPTTYAFWCKSSTTGGNKGVFGHGGDRNGAFHFNEDGTRPLLWLNNSYYVYWVANTAQDDDKWHQWVVYLDLDITKCKLYCDGVLQTVSAIVGAGVSSPAAYTESLSIGGDKAASGSYFEGQIDEFAVFDRELKQDEITRMYNTYYTPNRVANGNFAQIGNEEVSNGDFSQEGSEEVSNGDFATDTDWDKKNGSTISGGVGNVIANGDLGNTGANWSLNQDVGMIVGKSYKISFSARQTGGTGNFQVGQAYKIGFSQSITSSFENYTFIITPNDFSANTGKITIGGATVGNTFEVDNVSVKEVGQDWSFGAGWSMGDNKAVRVASSSTDLVQAGAFPSGFATKQFKISFDVVRSAGAVRLRAGTLNTPYVSATDTYTYYVTPTSNDQLKFQADNDFVGSVTNITVKEVGQNWTLIGTATISDGKAHINSPSGELAEIIQTGSLVIGRNYKLNCDLDKTSGDTQFVNGGTFILVDGLNTINFTATTTNVYFKRGAGSVVSSLDNVVVQELKSDATNLMLNAGAYQSANPLITSTNSMEFDGVDDYMEVQNSSDLQLAGQEASFTFWTKLDSLSGGDQKFIAKAVSTGSDTSGYQIRTDNDDLIFQFFSSSWRTTTSTSFFTDLNWVNVTITIDSSYLVKMYKNGVEEFSGNIGYAIPANTGELLFGARTPSSPTNFLNGEMTEVGAYNRALTSLEVASLYNQGMPTNLLVNRNDYQSGNPTVFNTKQVDFDGSDDYLQLGNFNNLGTSDCSFSFWVNLDSATNVTFAGKFQDNSNRVIFYTNGANQISTQARIGGNYAWNFTGTGTPVLLTPYLNKWTHIAFSIDRSANLLIFINGELKSTTSISSTASTNVDNTGNWFFGQANGSFLNGKISQSGMWNKALTANEVSSLYNHGLPVDLKTNQAAYTSSSNLVGYWRMGSGTLDSFPLIADQTNATLGSELVTNGNFTGVTNGTDVITLSGWGAYGSPTSRNVVDNKLVIVATGGNQGAIYAVGSLSGTYKLSVDVTGDVGAGAIYIESPASNNITTSVGTVDYYFVASGTTSIYFRAASNSAGTTSYTNISVKQVNGNPAIMTNMTASDIENGSPYAQLVENSDFATDSDWTKGAGWTISGGKATLVAQAGSSSLNSVVMSVTSGKTHKVTVNVSATSTGFRLYDSAGVVSYGLEIGENIHYTIPSSSSYQITPLGLAGASGSVDSVTVEEVNTGLQGYWKMGDGINDEYPVIYDQTNPTLGAEEVTNGDFTNDSDWNKGTGWTIANGKASSNGSGGSFIYQSLSSLTTGDTLKVVYEIVDYTSGQIRIGFGSGFSNFGTYRSALGTYTEYIKKTSSNTTFGLVNNSSNSFIGSIDNVSVKEVQGNPATMTNMVEGNITNQYPLTKIRNYWRMGDGILDKFPCIQDQTSPNLAHIPTTNLILYSEDLSVMQKVSLGTASAPVTTSNYATAPDGTQTATRVVFNLNGGTSTGDRSLLRQQIPSSLINFYSIYVKSTDGTEQTIIWHDGGEYSQTTVTNEWVRIFYDARINTVYAGIALRGGLGANTSDILAWGFQAEEQTQATAYLKSDGVASVRKATTTNLITYSEDFENAAWSISELSFGSKVTSPIGTNDAITIIETDATAQHNIFDTVVFTNEPYTLSCYAKLGTSSNRGIFLRVRNGNTSGTSYGIAWFNLSNATFTISGGISANIENVGNGWYRCSLTVTAPNSSSFCLIGLADGNSNFYDGDGTSNVLIWGSQVEQQTQAETYAKTTGLPVTIDLFTENNYGTMTNMVAGDIVLDTPNNPA